MKQISIQLSEETINQIKSLALLWGEPEQRHNTSVISRCVERVYQEEYQMKCSFCGDPAMPGRKICKECDKRMEKIEKAGEKGTRKGRKKLDPYPENILPQNYNTSEALEDFRRERREIEQMKR